MIKYNILAADDSPTFLKVIEHFLKRAGYNVHLAKDGIECLLMAKKIKPDIKISYPSEFSFVKSASNVSLFCSKEWDSKANG